MFSTLVELAVEMLPEEDTCPVKLCVPENVWPMSVRA
jgi:hypothetical protein